MRALNAVADAEPLDVLVDDDVKAGALAPGATSSYAQFDSGTRDVKVRSSTSQSVLTDKSVSFSSGANSTLVMYGKRNSLSLQLMADDTTSPSSGRFRLRVLNLAPDAGLVDLYVTAADISSAAPVVANAAYGAITSIAEAATGSYRLTFTAAGTQDVLFQSSPVSLTADNVTIAAVPSPGGKLVNAVLLTHGDSGSGTLLPNPLARLKATNAIADAASLNFKADDTTLLSNVPFGGSSSYVTTAAGARTLEVEAANIPGVTIASLPRQLAPARDYSVVALGTLAALQIATFADDNTLPAPGFAKLRFVNALAGSSAVDALVNFASQTSQIGFATASSYYPLAPSTTYTITFATTGGVTVIATLSPAELDATGVYTAYLMGTAAAPQVRLVRDR
jgi:hypothetical protein